MSGYVYLMAKVVDGKAVSPVKVGITAGDPVSRLRTIQTSCPFKIGLVHYLFLPSKECAQVVERGFHDVYASECSHGEWFNMEPKKALLCLCCALETLFDTWNDFTKDEYELAKDLSGLTAVYHNELYGDIL